MFSMYEQFLRQLISSGYDWNIKIILIILIQFEESFDI